jgi:hypothetical protein
MVSEMQEKNKKSLLNLRRGVIIMTVDTNTCPKEQLDAPQNRVSRLRQWPCKIPFVPDSAPYFDGAELEILSSMDNSFPSLYFSLNDTSVISRLKFDNGKTVMLLADATHHLTRQRAATYKESLKSDYLQMAHHGLIGGDIELYKFIDPEVCLWPVKPECFSGTLEGQKYKWCLGEGGLEYNAWIRDDSVKVRQHYDHSETASFEF